MKLAAPYPLKKERRELIDEYNIDFDSERHDIQDLIDWVRKNKDTRVNIKMINQPIGLKNLLLLKDLNADLAIRVQPEQDELLDTYRQNQIKFFFDYDFNINSFCRLQDALEQGVSDVYIMEDLCYRLPQVRAICDSADVQIRCLINMIPSFTIRRGTDITSTFYVPENFDALEQYYDVIEFELFNSWNRFDTLYDIWFVKKEWREDLKFINFELSESIPGESFPRELCEFKMKCGHRCVERQVSCRKCQSYIDLARSMHKKGIEYTSEQKWVESNKDEPIEDIFL